MARPPTLCGGGVRGYFTVRAAWMKTAGSEWTRKSAASETAPSPGAAGEDDGLLVSKKKSKKKPL
ncbi:hypothetical protein KAW55_00590 [bacterium]|nr:hypothetical protein [bacterium]